MNPIFLLVLAALCVAQFLLPRRLAFLPLLIAACHLGNLEIAANVTACRLIILLGLLRAIGTNQLRWSLSNPLDASFGFFGFIAIVVSFAPREDIASPFRQNLGLILNVVGCYLYGKAFLHGSGFITRFATCLAIVLLPLSLGLAVEKVARKNAYFLLGSGKMSVMEREGKVRASGPFRHPILSGTLGATSLPLMIYLWRRKRTLAIVGASACMVIVVSSASSGPLAALGGAIFAMGLWKWRRHIGTIQKVAIALIIIMHFSSSRGIWYLMARMDLAGGSTGYHRAKLIDSAMSHIDKWWLAGTDYTRDWMFSGVSWSTRHTDITNYYLHMGVIGGLGLLLALVFILITAFRMLGRGVKFGPARFEDDPVRYDLAFGAWCLGAALFAHALSMLSVSYFDQMYAMFYLLVGAVPGAAALVADPGEDDEMDSPAIGDSTRPLNARA